MPLTNERRWYQEPALVLARLQPQVREILDQYAVPEGEAERLIQDTLLALLYKWDEISNPDHWLLKTLEHRCVRLYAQPATTA